MPTRSPAVTPSSLKRALRELERHLWSHKYSPASYEAYKSAQDELERYEATNPEYLALKDKVHRTYMEYKKKDDAVREAIKKVKVMIETHGAVPQTIATVRRLAAKILPSRFPEQAGEDSDG